MTVCAVRISPGRYLIHGGLARHRLCEQISIAKPCECLSACRAVIDYPSAGMSANALEGISVFHDYHLADCLAATRLVLAGVELNTRVDVVEAPERGVRSWPGIGGNRPADRTFSSLTRCSASRNARRRAIPWCTASSVDAAVNQVDPAFGTVHIGTHRTGSERRGARPGAVSSRNGSCDPVMRPARWPIPELSYAKYPVPAAQESAAAGPSSS